MARYIDADEALKIIDNYTKTITDDGKVVAKAIRDVVEIICPEADVVEVKHGHWVRQEKMVGGKVQAEAVCSSCGTDVVYQVIDNRWQFENYCPHCGARMDGDTQ